MKFFSRDTLRSRHSRQLKTAAEGRNRNDVHRFFSAQNNLHLEPIFSHHMGWMRGRCDVCRCHRGDIIPARAPAPLWNEMASKPQNTPIVGFGLPWRSVPPVSTSFTIHSLSHSAAAISLTFFMCCRSCSSPNNNPFPDPTDGGRADDEGPLRMEQL